MKRHWPGNLRAAHCTCPRDAQKWPTILQKACPEEQGMWCHPDAWHIEVMADVLPVPSFYKESDLPKATKR